MYDIGIIGGGTAGLTAAIYGQRAGKKTIVFEGKNYGGQIALSPNVENYPGIASISGAEYSMNLMQQAVNLGAETQMEEVIGVREIWQEEESGVRELWQEEESGVQAAEIEAAAVARESGKAFVVETPGKDYVCRTIVIATGVTHRHLGIEREEQMTGSGVSYCATCDGMFFRGRDVAVIGGGNTALQDAEFLSNYCNKVYVVHRRDEFRGEARLVEALKKKENVEFVLSAVPKEITGEYAVDGLIVTNKKTDTDIRLDVAGIFVAVGHIPKNEMFAELVQLDAAGFVQAGEDCLTSRPGVFAAGDCRTKEVRQLTTAAADGAVAALAAVKHCGM